MYLKKVLPIFILTGSCILIASLVNAQSNTNWNDGFNSHSNNSISINFDETNIDFGFYSIEDYKSGIGGKNSQYQTTGDIKAKNDWVLSFAAIEPFLHENGTTSIPLDNVGVTISTRDYSRLINYAENSPAVLSAAPVTILQSRSRDERGNSNPNYSFTVYFEMGTSGKGMNQKPILEQNLPKGEYRTTVEFIIRENL